jgi:polyisoprenoid-binding protein YceI
VTPGADTDPSPDSPDASAPRSRRRLLVWLAVGLVAVVALGYGAVFLYTEVINDAPDELTAEDLADRLQNVTTTTAAPAVTSAPEDGTETTVAATTAPDAGDGAASEVEGDWVVTDASELGYRVTEVLFGVDTQGVGRTNQITGGLTIEGADVTAAEFEVDVASIESDDGRRDNQFRGRIMATDEFPTATFVLTSPIELGEIPEPDVQITATAVGDLTLRGVTNEVTFEVTAQLTEGRIGVLGAIPIVFADYEIANPSIPGITTEDNGLLEFVLVFER